MKIVVNNCWGGFSLSKQLIEELNLNPHEGIDRTNPKLVEAVERDSEAASGNYSELIVKEIPDGKFWMIVDYDGLEEVYYSDSPIISASEEEK